MDNNFQNKSTADSFYVKKSFTRFIPHIVRLLMGFMFFVFGLNGFLNFIPMPETLPAPAMAFMSAMMETHYMMPLISGTQLLVGVLLLLSLFVPLALALIAPVVVNIFLYHIFVDTAGMGIAIAVVIMEVYLAWAYRAAYCPMLAPRVKPSQTCRK